jgi:hypothetical protein
MEGDVTRLKTDVANLLVAFFEIAMNTKKVLNVSYSDIEDKIFKLKEAEKYTFTDRLRDMTEEERAVDTILKHNKLGSLYSIGLSKGIREYDPDNFDHDKKVAEKITEIQNKLKRRNINNDDLDEDVDDAIERMEEDREIDMDNAMMNNTEDYYDGDPWGEEQDLDDINEYD